VSVQVASTTAWGDAQPLDTALATIAANTDARVVELAIGARPVADPLAVLDSWRHRFTFIGHHTVPLASGQLLRPWANSPEEILDACVAAGITRYTLHPPTRKQSTLRRFYDMAVVWFDAAAARGVECAFETMYPAGRQELAENGGWHLATPADIDRFVTWAQHRGVDMPLVVDVSHLAIGVGAGVWTQSDAVELLDAGVAYEWHYSQPRGCRDAHDPLGDGHFVNGWLHGRTAGLMVDEGRRRISHSTSR
jgi:hypothetical protein